MTKGIGFTCGAFDLLHAGHILMLEEAKSQCDHLIVGLQNDPTVDRPEKNKPVQSIVERQIQLSAVKFVDDIIIYNTEQDLMDLLKTLPIDVRIIGEDYIGKDFTGKQLCQERGIQVYYNARQHNFSSSNMRERVFKAEQSRKIVPTPTPIPEAINTVTITPWPDGADMYDNFQPHA